MNHQKKKIGFACAYTPLSLINAAGFSPYRILPNEECPDQAGQLLHDNLCPHIKRILDRAMANQLPELSGMIFMNSCDAMRRLKDAWQVARPDIKSVLIDLPTTTTDSALVFFKDELQKLSLTLLQWGGETVTREKLEASIQLYNKLANVFAELSNKVKQECTQNGTQLLQSLYLKASCTPPEEMVDALMQQSKNLGAEKKEEGVPIYLFGNVLPEAEAFELFASCGARVIGEDLCTGSRLFAEILTNANGFDDMLFDVAREILNKKPCARTIIASQPGQLARDVVMNAKKSGARGVIAYSLKFCDPYIARLPSVRAALKQENLPFLLLEGDCTIRSMGQQKTRIEAFVEMLG